MQQNEIEKLREISIVSLLGLKDSGRRHFIKCPFHSDTSPSMMIYPDNSYKCYGCGRQGRGAISFLMESGANFVDVVEELKRI